MNTIIRANLNAKEDIDLMCEALYELFADELIKYKNDGIRIGKEAGFQSGKQSGIKIGEQNGMKIGENLLSNLILKLISDNRSSEIERVAADPDYRAALMKQYHLK